MNENLTLKALMNCILGPVYTRSDPNGSVPKVSRIGLAITQGLTDPNPFGSAIRTQTGSLSKVIPFGSDPKKVSCKQVGSDPNWYG